MLFSIITNWTIHIVTSGNSCTVTFLAREKGREISVMIKVELYLVGLYPGPKGFT